MAPKGNLESRLGYRFKNPALLDQALHHASLSKIKAISPFERLEFLGDRVLSLVVAHWLYTLYPEEAEGSLAVRHSALVKRATLVAVAQQLDLQSDLHYDQQKGVARLHEKIIADSCEALLGALFLDGGLEAAEKRIKVWWKPYLKAQKIPPINPKSYLQEWAQAQGLPVPFYRVLHFSGPDHQPLFTLQVEVEGFPVVQASGSSKKQAEIKAAEKFLSDLPDRKV